MESKDKFVKLPHWVIEDSDLTGNELLVYISLLRHRNPRTGKCYPGFAAIADQARMSKRTAMRTIEALETRGIISVQRRHNQNNIYTVGAPAESNARGTRIPKRKPRFVTSDTESPSAANDAETAAPSDSVALPSDSVSPQVVTPSHPKEEPLKKNHKEDSEVVLPSTTRTPFPVSHDVITDTTTTEAQYALLWDLYIHITCTIPEHERRRQWKSWSISKASDTISSYYKELGRGGNYTGPEPDTEEYIALTPEGRRWADEGCVPEGWYEAA